MALANIENLLKKYEEGTTSLQEEAKLKKYFTSKNVAPHLEEYGLLFNYFSMAKNAVYQKEISLSHKKSKPKNYKWLSIAAFVLVLFSVFLGQQEFKEYQERKKVEKIYKNVTKGFSLLSSNLKKGTKAIDQFYVQETKINKILK